MSTSLKAIILVVVIIAGLGVWWAVSLTENGQTPASPQVANVPATHENAQPSAAIADSPDNAGSASENPAVVGRSGQARPIAEPDEAVAEVGQQTGEPLETGFFFLDGQYIDAPYQVDRRGLAVTVNGHEVFRWSRWPLPKPVTEDPGMPVGLTRDSTLEDLRTGQNFGHERRVIIYLHRNHPPQAALNKTADFYRKLPFIRDVRFEYPSIIEVTTVGGDKELIDISPPQQGAVSSGELTVEDVRETLERKRARYEKRLASGQCIFHFSTGGELSFGRVKAAKDLKLMVDLLSSDRNREEKVRWLERMNILPPEGAKQFHSLIDRFRRSEKLNQRIATLIESSGHSIRWYDDLPAGN